MSTAKNGVLGIVLLLGCHAGAKRIGASCDELSPCNGPQTCIQGRCELSDAATSGGDVAADGVDSGDTKIDAADDSKADATDDAASDRLDDSGVDAADTSNKSDALGEEAGSSADANGRPEPDRHPSMVVLATTDSGGVWLIDVPLDSVNGPVDNETMAIDVTAAAGPIGFVDDVEAQAVGSVVHVLARTGRSVLATSYDGEDWAPWRQVANDVSAFGLANVAGQPWACLLSGAGRLRLAFRKSSGEWDDLGDVTSESSLPVARGEAPGPLTKLDCAGIGAELNVLALDGAGHLWEAVKKPADWSPFKRVTTAGALVLTDIDVSNGAADLHALGSDNGDQFHGVRAGGTWTDFGSVELSSLSDPMGEIRAGAMTAILLEVEWLQVNSFGEIWFCSRFRAGTQWFIRIRSMAGDGRPFSSISATTVLPY